MIFYDDVDIATLVPIDLFDEPDENEAPDPLDVKLGLAVPSNARVNSKGTAPDGIGQRERDLQRLADIERRRAEQDRLVEVMTRIKIERYAAQ